MPSAPQTSCVRATIPDIKENRIKNNILGKMSTFKTDHDLIFGESLLLRKLILGIASSRKVLGSSCRACTKKQFMCFSMVSWEGAVNIKGSHTGQGFMELQGYAANSKHR
jgi:hypothetical protein